MVALGIDYGGRYIGVAVGDTEIGVATPKAVVENRGKDFVLDEFEKLVKESGAVQMVVGLPLNFKMQETPSSERVRLFARTLGEQLKLPVDFENEILSSAHARRLDPESKKRGRHAIVAALILQSWLDKHSSRF